MKQTIYFDMDGTIADFYNVPNWLTYLKDYDCTPYQQAKPLLNFSQFAKILKKLQKNYNIGIISWTSKSKNYNFHNETIVIKKEWLKKHLPSMKYILCYTAQIKIFIIKAMIFYSMMKSKIGKNGQVKLMMLTI